MSGAPTLPAQQADELPGAYWDAKARSLYENSFTSGLEWPLYGRLPDVEKAYWVARAALTSGATQPSEPAMHHNFTTHRTSWRAAIATLANKDDSGYWPHELKAFDEAYATPPTGEPLTAPSDGYMEAFYELGKLMGIPAQPTSPERVWREQMLPRLRAALAATAAPTESEPTDDEIISLARIASASNNYEGGRFISGNFNREDLIAFGRGLLVRASLPPHPTGGEQ